MPSARLNALVPAALALIGSTLLPVGPTAAQEADPAWPPAVTVTVDQTAPPPATAASAVAPAAVRPMPAASTASGPRASAAAPASAPTRAAAPVPSPQQALTAAPLPAAAASAADRLPHRPVSAATGALDATPAEPPTAGPAARRVDAEAPAPSPAGSPRDPPAALSLQEAPAVDSVVETTALREDLWARVRRHYGIEDLDNDRVRRWEQFYLARPDYLERMFERGGLYLFHIVEEVMRRGLPTELALLPFIESAFNPLALSSAKASGIWQFMPATGRHFDLRQNLFRDDRRSVLDSTRAALDYLQQLHGMFGDWHLALAAYNWGQGNVARAQAGNRRRGRGTGYLDLTMPDETRNYVPKLQAIANLVEHPQRYGLTLPPLENHPYFLTVTVDRDIDVDLVARLAGVSVDDFRALNPQHNKPIILAAATPQLLLPFDNARRFRVELDRHQGPLASWTAWVAPRTLSVRDAARKIGMDDDDLRALNRIPAGKLIKAGSTLLVPRAASSTADVPEHVAETASIALAAERPTAGRRIVRVGPRGESVAAMARRYRVSAAQLAEWNGVPMESRLRPGQRIVLNTGGASGRPQARAQKSSAGVARPATARSPATKAERARVQARPTGRESARGG